MTQPAAITKPSRCHLSRGTFTPEEHSPKWWREYIAKRVHLIDAYCPASHAASVTVNPSLPWSRFRRSKARCRQCMEWVIEHLPDGQFEEIEE